MNDNTRIRIAVPAHLYESVKKQLTLNEAAAKFKKGDKVKVTIPTSNMANKVGTITKVELGKNLPYEVSDSKGPAGNFKASQLKLAEGLNEAAAKFKKGDKVKVMTPTSNMANKVGTITKVELDKNLPYEVSDSKGPAGNFKASQLKLAEGINEAKQNFGAGYTAVKEKKNPSESKPKVEGMKSSKAPKMEAEKTEKTVEERLAALEEAIKALTKEESVEEGMEDEIGYEAGEQHPDDKPGVPKSLAGTKEEK